ncbi:MAG TPA: hypothetical protein VHC39_02845 [Rhizomicrobium sp.]|nr:hypothetical protein [Rhizomicrobium sp.]
MKFGTLSAAMFMLFAVAGSAVAQPVGGLPPAAGIAAEQRAEISASVATTKADVKTTRATREQIQALRLALKAKLAAMRH